MFFYMVQYESSIHQCNEGAIISSISAMAGPIRPRLWARYVFLARPNSGNAVIHIPGPRAACLLGLVVLCYYIKIHARRKKSITTVHAKKAPVTAPSMATSDRSRIRSAIFRSLIRSSKTKRQ